MNRAQLELVVSEVARRFDLDYFYVVGSAAVLAWIPDATAGILTATRDVDVIPQPVEPERLPRVMDQIDFVLGEASDFDIQHGVYAQAVDDSTVAYAPVGWKNRAIPLRVGRKTAMCMDLHDLMLSKYGAGREKDLLFNRALAGTGIVSGKTLVEHLQDVRCDDRLRELIHARIAADLK
jgi:hypothetical protein